MLWVGCKFLIFRCVLYLISDVIIKAKRFVITFSAETLFFLQNNLTSMARDLFLFFIGFGTSNSLLARGYAPNSRDQDSESSINCVISWCSPLIMDTTCCAIINVKCLSEQKKHVLCIQILFKPIITLLMCNFLCLVVISSKGYN